MDQNKVVGVNDFSVEDQQKILQKLAALSLEVLLDVASNNLSGDEDLSVWLDLLKNSPEESSAPLDFLNSKIPDFDKLYQEALKQEWQSVKNNLPIFQKEE